MNPPPKPVIQLSMINILLNFCFSSLIQCFIANLRNHFTLLLNTFIDFP